MDSSRLSGGRPGRRYGETRQQQSPSFGTASYTDSASAFNMTPSPADNSFIQPSSATYTTIRSVHTQHHLYSSPPEYVSQRYTATDMSSMDQYHLARSHPSNAGPTMDQLYLADQSLHQYSRSDLDLSSHSTLESSESFNGMLPTSSTAAAYFPLTEQWYPPLQTQPHHHQPSYYVTSAPSSSTSSPHLPTSHPTSLFPPPGTPCPSSSSRLSPLSSGGDHHHYHYITAGAGAGGRGGSSSIASMTDDDTQDTNTPTSQPSPSPRDLTEYGIPNPDGSWRCAYPGCTSQTTFRRGCDLRKHFNRHRKHLFCRYPECAQSTTGGFSSKKDRDRHEAKHNPGISCEWPNCRRMFSRVDNMKDHVRRVHRRDF
ncbi:putative C2H2 transcription factor [Aspergillus affinis]|uniref:putative C2H2 transcription factor n=1 Tax=Aspergillus affinis TaxID=1070780 RepID=UPI0022FE3E55|nr:uncharacterized protein KD926_002526 [Aspergillus affinis]KAI9036004.1 hypothetical protein KD926_002526 [Aspergillus affinis]